MTKFEPRYGYLFVYKSCNVRYKTLSFQCHSRLSGIEPVIKFTIKVDCTSSVIKLIDLPSRMFTLMSGNYVSPTCNCKTHVTYIDNYSLLAFNKINKI